MNISKTIQELIVEEVQDDKKISNGAYLWHLPRLFACSFAISVVVMLGYVEIGHDKGWKRADIWHTCLHTHHHFPWQNVQ